MLDAAVVDRVRGALWGVYIADALSMPVHWCVRSRPAARARSPPRAAGPPPPPARSLLSARRYYDPGRIGVEFGRINKYYPPNKQHPSSSAFVLRGLRRVCGG